MNVGPVRNAGDMLRIEQLAYHYDHGAAAVADVSFELGQGRFLCLLGPSGCGKTTLLRLLGGYLYPSAGRILLGDTEIGTRAPEQRDIGMVFQSYALFPHLSARDNVAFPLVVRGVARAERTRRVEGMLDRVHLAAAERARRPSELSGGQQQRVALARALVFEPRVLLLDEPFANLDRQLRERLRTELKELQHQTGVTTVLVTHDQDEALSLADEVALMLHGRFVQYAAPQVLYRQPRTELAARLLGDANVLSVEAIDAHSLHFEGGLRAPRPAGAIAAVGTRVLVRPEDCILVSADELHTCSGRVVSAEYFGVDCRLWVAVAPSVRLRVRARPGQHARVGELVHVCIAPEHLWLIPEADPLWARQAPA
jgi:ABC-type Fe3+/spermidine/putrescine transport system ATPase subunit